MNQSAFARFFESFAQRATKATGSSTAFLLALATVLIWIVTGPLFHYSDTWQLVINTGTTIVTFLMVFLIQKSQNKDSLAMQIKLNELIAINRKASNRLLNVEELSEDELLALHEFFGRLADKSRQEDSLSESHSLEEAETIRVEKLEEKHRRQQSKKNVRTSLSTDT